MPTSALRCRPQHKYGEILLISDPHASLRDRALESVLEGPGVSDSAIRNAAADGSGVPADLQSLVDKIHRHAYKVTDEQVQGLREVGWSDEQIAEAAYDAALFNLFVRLADTFGIEPPAMYEPDGVPKAASTL